MRFFHNVIRFFFIMSIISMVQVVSHISPDTSVFAIDPGYYFLFISSMFAALATWDWMDYTGKRLDNTEKKDA